MGPVILDNRVKFGYPRLNLSREIPPEAVWGGIFYSFFLCSFRPEVGRDVISGSNVGQFGVDVPVKLGDASPNVSPDIQRRSRLMRHFRLLI